MLSYIKFVNVIITDFARSIDFYRDKLGMRAVYGPFAVFGTEIATAFGITNTGTEVPLPVELACFFRWSDDDNDVVVNLGWWQRPPPDGRPYPSIFNVGHQRMTFKVQNIDQVYRDLVAKGIKFNTPPITLDLGRRVRVCYFDDPDGIHLGLLDDSPTTSKETAALERIHHVSTCVRDLEESLKVYRDVLGMQVVLGPFDLEGRELADALALRDSPDIHARGVWIRPDDGEHGLMELIEWKQPSSTGQPYSLTTPAGSSFAQHVGIPRVGFWVEDVQGVYDTLVGRGVKFINPPVTTDMGPDTAYCCFLNPDGTVLQLYKYVRGNEREF